jgi:hypothetical protein
MRLSGRQGPCPVLALVSVKGDGKTPSGLCPSPLPAG